jgi:hypothetical protein
VKPPVVDQNGYGLRVPGLVISPYAKRGYIDHQVLSHDACVKFIEDDFLGGQRLDPATDGRPDPRADVRENLPQLGNLITDFDFSQSPRPPVILPVTPRTDLIHRAARAVRPPRATNFVLIELANFLATTPEHLLAELENGEPAARIASESETTVKGLEQAVIQPVQARSQDPLGTGGGPVNMYVIKAEAADLGITPVELRSELRHGSKVTQIAIAHGTTLAALSHEVLATFLPVIRRTLG